MAFQYSGTGLESAIQSGSGGIGTGSSITLEVDAVPSDLSQGDTVKVALGPASDWSSGNGETAYGDIGGAGANGGTNITLTDRGQEGTSAASWNEGDPVRVGVQGRQNARRSDGIAGLYDPSRASTPMAHEGLLPLIGGIGTATPGSGRTRIIPLQVPNQITVQNLACKVTTGTDTNGTTTLVLYDSNRFFEPNDLVVSGTITGEDTAGVKVVSVTNTTILPGLYFVGQHVDSNYTSIPEFAVVSQGPLTPTVGRMDRNFNEILNWKSLASPFSTTSPDDPFVWDDFETLAGQVVVSINQSL